MPVNHRTTGISPKSVLGVPGSREQGEHKSLLVSTLRLRLRRFNFDFLDEFLSFCGTSSEMFTKKVTLTLVYIYTRKIDEDNNK